MIYDEEQMLADIETVYKAQLNTAISNINTEKGAVSGDDLFLEPISTNDYIFETLDSRINNHRGFFIMYGLLPTVPREQNEVNFIEDVKVTFQIGTFDNGEKFREVTFKKLLRYRRALKQVIINNPDIFRGYAKPLVGSLRPDALPYDNRRVILKIGIDIEASNTAN